MENQPANDRKNVIRDAWLTYSDTVLKKPDEVRRLRNEAKALQRQQGREAHDIQTTYEAGVLLGRESIALANGLADGIYGPPKKEEPKAEEPAAEAVVA
jgi:hypothetical protein